MDRLRCAPAVASAALPERAEAGGAALAPFLEGIEDSRHAGLDDVHQSLLGHLYGSTTSSYGLTEVRPGVVDDYAAFGSPGTQPGYDLNVPDGHNFVLKNREDPVTYVGDTLMIHGDDPADDNSFTELDANKDLHLNPFGAHSTYFEEDSVALDSLSRVVAGKAG
ncbi:alpha/beta hydrolase [Actinobaculum sp. 352]|uniref:alpha/beta hydrolase n=1 Tax=Actinobaculum sp. 352 TaxID=2490946 RepID=UPI000F7D9DE0|nr:alpha/beta hydrolase [Actinobaculum sp. 352]RTE50601.1 hypothetical protein EKN07_00105 [Actinobaculum sp. 352]